MTRQLGALRNRQKGGMAGTIIAHDMMLIQLVGEECKVFFSNAFR